MTSTEIRKKIDKLRTLTTRDARFRPAKWLPLWEIAYQLAVLNEAELVPSVLPPGFFLNLICVLVPAGPFSQPVDLRTGLRAGLPQLRRRLRRSAALVGFPLRTPRSKK